MNIQNNQNKINTDFVFQALSESFGPDIQKSMEEMYSKMKLLHTHEECLSFLKSYWKLHAQLAQIGLVAPREEENV